MLKKWILITLASIVIGYFLGKIRFYGYLIYFIYVFIFGDSGPEIINKITNAAFNMAIPISLVLGQIFFLIYKVANNRRNRRGTP